MNSAELADKIAADHDLTKVQARQIVDGVMSAITEAAGGGDEVALNGFGRFKVTERAARQGRNPATGETIQIAASRKLGFTAAKSVRDQLNATHGAGARGAAKPGGKAAAPGAKKAAARR